MDKKKMTAEKWVFYAVLTSSAILVCLTRSPKARASMEKISTRLTQVLISQDSVSIILDGKFQHRTFQMSQPPRIVVDLLGTKNEWQYKEFHPKGDSLIARIRSSQFQQDPSITRVVVDLKKRARFKTRVDGSRLIIGELAAFEEEPGEEEGDPSLSLIKNSKDTPIMAMAPTQKSAADSNTELLEQEAPEFLKQSESEANPKFSNLSKDAATSIVNEQEKVKTKELSTAALKSVVDAVASPSEPSSLFGRRLVTLDFYDIDVRELFKILGEKADVNVVYGNQVGGTISIQLRDVPFKDAVDTALALSGLRIIILGKNIVQVMTPKELDDYKTRAISMTKVFPINYAKATDVNTQLTSILSTLGGKGKTIVDDRTNSIIVTDTPEGIESTSRLIQDLDKPTPQVMIEAKIVQVSLGKSIDLGIAWGVAYTDQGNGQMVTIGAAKQTDSGGTTFGGSGALGLQDRSPLNPSGSGLEQGGAGFSPSVGMGLAFGFVKDAVRLNAALSALQQKNKSKLLSNPKVATLNNQPAVIKSEIAEPYITKEVSFSQGQSVTAEKVNTAKSGISLSVTPTINADGRITMKILPDVTSSQPTSIGVPKTTSQQADTTVIVRDGDTFVIGGLISEIESDQSSFIPILGQIPLIGNLFKKTGKSKSRAELLVFVTPRIIPF